MAKLNIEGFLAIQHGRIQVFKNASVLNLTLGWTDYVNLDNGKLNPKGMAREELPCGFQVPNNILDKGSEGYCPQYTMGKRLEQWTWQQRLSER